MSTTDDSGISDYAIVIYMWLTMGVVVQVFNIFGIITNIINIMCFCRIGFDDSVNVSVLGLSVSDLGSLLMMTVTCIGFTPAMASADLSFLPQEVVVVASALPHITFTRVSSCITAMITLERCLCVTVPLKVKDIITPKLVAVVNIGFFVLFFISDVPNFTAHKLGMKYVPLRNKTLLGIVGTADRETIQMITFIINTFSIPLGAFLIIVVCTTILSVQLRINAKLRGKAVTSSQNDKVSRRNYKVVKMVVIMSILFIICFIPISTCTLATAFVPELSALGKYLKVSLLAGSFGYLLESVNSSVNIFFYIKVSSHYRTTFHSILLKIQKNEFS